MAPYDERLTDGLQVLRYNLTTAYNSHVDYLDDNGGGHDYDSAGADSNRFATILFYLSDVAQGGETVFPKGRAVDDGVTDDPSDGVVLRSDLMRWRRGNASLELRGDETDDTAHENDEGEEKEGEEREAAAAAAGGEAVVAGRSEDESGSSSGGGSAQQRWGLVTKLPSLFAPSGEGKGGGGGGGEVQPDLTAGGRIVPGSWEGRMVQQCRSKLAVRPTKAHAILFYSQHPDGVHDPSSLHGGCPVLEGTKWAANLWIWNKVGR